MIKILPILLILIFPVFSYGQAKYKKCTVYSKYLIKSKDSNIGKTLYYNDYGRLIKDVNYQTHKSSYYTYYKDTQLLKKVTIEDEHLNDTVLTLYYYNSENQVAEIFSAKYGLSSIHTCMGSIDDGIKWYDSLKTVFQYDKKGNMTGELTYETGDNFRGGFSPDFVPNCIFYTYDNMCKLTSKTYMQIWTLKENGINFINEYHRPDTSVLAKETFSYLQQCYTATLDQRNTSTNFPICKMSIFFYDAHGNVIHEYIDNQYLVDPNSNETFEGPVEKFYSYDQGKRLSREFLYNSQGKLQKMNTYTYE